MDKRLKKASALPHELRRIRLELAREPGHPDGSNADGYELIAPLDRSGRIDAALWREHRRACGVRRFRAGQEDTTGHLVHRPGGAWVLHYDGENADADEAGYRFQQERFEVGEYLSIVEDDKQHTYRVVSVEHV